MSNTRFNNYLNCDNCDSAHSRIYCNGDGANLSFEQHANCNMQDCTMCESTPHRCGICLAINDHMMSECPYRCLRCANNRARSGTRRHHRADICPRPPTRL